MKVKRVVSVFVFRYMEPLKDFSGQRAALVTLHSVVQVINPFFICYVFFSMITGV